MPIKLNESENGANKCVIKNLNKYYEKLKL